MAAKTQPHTTAIRFHQISGVLSEQTGDPEIPLDAFGTVLGSKWNEKHVVYDPRDSAHPPPPYTANFPRRKLAIMRADPVNLAKLLLLIGNLVYLEINVYFNQSNKLDSIPTANFLPFKLEE